MPTAERRLVLRDHEVRPCAHCGAPAKLYDLLARIEAEEET